MSNHVLDLYGRVLMHLISNPSPIHHIYHVLNSHLLNKFMNDIESLIFLMIFLNTFQFMGRFIALIFIIIQRIICI